MFITNGHRAHAIVLVTKTDPDAGHPHDGFTLFLVPMDLTRRDPREAPEKLGMHASEPRCLRSRMSAYTSRPSGQVGRGFYHIFWELQGERLIGAAGSVAGAQHVFDRTLEYAKERIASGARSGASR